MAETNKSKMMSEAEIIEAINSDSLVSVSLGSGQPQKNEKLSTLASVVAGLMPFQRIASFPVIGSADWMLLGRIPPYSAVVFLYSNITFVNTMPALYAVTAYNYNSSQFELFCNLVVGSSGGDFTSNIKYKLVDNEVYIWVKGSAGYASHLMILSGILNVEGIIETPPVDAIQPSVV